MMETAASFQSIGITDAVPGLQQMPKSLTAPGDHIPAETIAANAKQLQDIVLKARPELAVPSSGGGATNGKPATSNASGTR